jgi:YVTN family beta-propeller protein
MSMPRCSAALCAAAIALAGAACADSPEASVAAAGRIYVSNETAGTVVVIDPTSLEVERDIPVGKRPRGIHLTADGTRLLVALSGSPISPPGIDESTLPPPDRSADDLESGTLVRTYPSGQDPEAFDLSHDGRLLYVSNEETAEMSVLDLETGTVIARVPVGEEPEGVTVSPDGSTVWVTCEAENEVVGVDTRSLTVVARVQTAPRPRSIVFTPDGKTMFVTGETGWAVSVVDMATRTARDIQLSSGDDDPLPPRPMGAVLSPGGGRLFVSNGRGKTISVIDVASREVIGTVEEVGERPWGIDISPDGRTLYTANGPSGDVSVVDVETRMVRRRISVGGSPWGVVVSTSASPGLESAH